ncbi:MAG: CCA tRNA nucleotidyltransferase [Candidatus Methanomethylophilaceae archaeon]|jgi:tRNA nucleotidyltransferase (CCA-adding enzyme)
MGDTTDGRGFSELESEIIEKITPDEREIKALEASAKRLEACTKEFVDKENLSVSEIRFVGSYAKGTYLSDPDLDLFLMFSPDIPRKQLEQEGLLVGEKILDGERLYAEHPYTRGFFEGHEVDMVPCYILEDAKKLKTSVDRTPLHTEYVLSRLGPEDRTHIRLLKKFMKGISVYGAEPDVRGFSGYLCELMIIKYGGFGKAIEAVSDWKEGTVVEIEGRGPGTGAPLTVYDPVDPRRNAASAVHLDTLSRFIVASKAYLEEPSERFFFPVPRTPLPSEELERKTNLDGTGLLTVIFERPDVIEENISAQLWRTQYALAKRLNDFGFGVLRAVHEAGSELRIVFELEQDILSKTFKHTGPPVWVKHSERFLERWKDNENGKPFIEDGKWNIIADRPYICAKDMICEEAAISGIGRELDPVSMKVLNHEETLRDVSPELLTELLDPRLSWEI